MRWTLLLAVCCTACAGGQPEKPPPDPVEDKNIYIHRPARPAGRYRLTPEEREALMEELRAKWKKWDEERPGPPCRGTVRRVQQPFAREFVTISFGTETRIRPLDYVNIYRHGRRIGRVKVISCSTGESLCISESETPRGFRDGDVAVWEESRWDD